MLEKYRFYERYGVEEYYIYDPEAMELEGYVRAGERWSRILELNSWEGNVNGRQENRYNSLSPMVNPS